MLPIQGPPGTSKTYVSARAILALVRSGARVGVASNSHEAIRNVLMGCLAAVEDEDLPITLEMAHKVSQGNDGYPDGIEAISHPTSNDDPALAEAHVVGGTAFFFAREQNIRAFDWLFVDEAGQVGLAIDQLAVFSPSCIRQIRQPGECALRGETAAFRRSNMQDTINFISACTHPIFP